MVLDKKISEKEFSVKRMTEKITDESSILFLFLSIGPVRRPRTHQKILNSHPMIPHTPNCGKWTFGDLFSGNAFSWGSLFQETFFPGDPFPGIHNIHNS